MINNLKKYFRVWYLLTVNSFAISLTSKESAFIFVLGKFIRLIFFLVFLITLVTHTKTLQGYTLSQTIFFYLTFNLLDTGTQLFLREVYRFRPLVVSGNFDLILLKPSSPLFRILAGGADPLDLLVLIILLFGLVAFFILYGVTSPLSYFLYFLLLANGFLIGVAFHILVAGIGVITTEIDHTIMIYRDLSSLGRVPIDVYREPLRFLITFIIPVGIMMSFPAKAFLGLLTWPTVFITLSLGILALLFSLSFWKFSLRKYTSASS
ncbi:ABC-2 family transporter protein [Candidatus Microgenomates bacterium]|nr:ABC-2 family transporter protein [Candidatus Microgenomates bacterium]